MFIHKRLLQFLTIVKVKNDCKVVDLIRQRLLNLYNMEKFLKWIKKHKKFVIVLSILIVIAPIFIVHFLFKIKTNNYWVVAEWNAGDILGYFGSILTFIGTVSLGCIAICQTQEANKLSNKIIELEWWKVKPSIDIIQNQKFILYSKRKQISKCMSAYNLNECMVFKPFCSTETTQILGIAKFIIKNTGNCDIRDIIIESYSNWLEDDKSISYIDDRFHYFLGNTYIKKGEKRKIFIEIRVPKSSYKYAKKKLHSAFAAFQWKILLITPDEIAFEELLSVCTKFIENKKKKRIVVLYTEEMFCKKLDYTAEI